MTALTDTPGALVITDAAAQRRSVRYEDFAGVRAYIRVDLTVRHHTCPHTGADRWAMVLDSDELSLWDYDSENDAVTAYEEPVRGCEQDYAQLDRDHAWHVCDLSGIPVLSPPTAAPQAPAPSRPVRHRVPAPPPPRPPGLPRYEIGQHLAYCGSLTQEHGPGVTAAIEQSDEGLYYELVTDQGGYLLTCVREPSIAAATA